MNHRLPSIAAQDGVAMIAAIGTLLVVSLLALVVATSSVRTSHTGNNDRSSKRALAAANAGLEVATYRLNTLTPAASSAQCITTAVTTPAAGHGVCAPVTESEGNGATHTYQVSIQKPANSACGGAALASGAIAAGSMVRCVTSTGTVNGVSRRVQTLIVAQPANPPYLPVQGVVGLDSVQLGNNTSSQANVGSNGAITVGNNSVIHQIELGPGATVSGSFTENNSRVVHPSPFTLQPAPVGTTATVNNNATGLAGYAGYSAATRDLNVTSRLVLPSGDYNFCRLTLGAQNSSSIEPAAGAQIRIFIDAPDDVRPGSGCPTTAGQGWGQINGVNGVVLGRFNGSTPFGSPADTQIFVVGWDPTANVFPGSKYGWNQIVVSKNNLEINGLLYAPWSDVQVGKNNADIYGGAAAKRIYVKNNANFVFDSSLANLGSAGGDFGRLNWSECRSRPVTSDPESGC
jgi:type II secretory pathway pseudopilin PulG